MRDVAGRSIVSSNEQVRHRQSFLRAHISHKNSMYAYVYVLCQVADKSAQHKFQNLYAIVQ